MIISCNFNPLFPGSTLRMTSGTFQCTRCLCEITWLTLMSNALSIPWCFAFQSKQSYPMSVLISVKGCCPVRKSAMSQFFYFWEHLQSALFKDDICAGRVDLLHGLQLPNLQRSGYDVNIQRYHSCYTVKAISRLCVLQPWPWSVYSFLVEHKVDVKVTWETMKNKRETGFIRAADMQPCSVTLEPKSFMLVLMDN